MHNRSQFDMRENPASDRGHGSRSALQKDPPQATRPHSYRQRTMLAVSDGRRVQSTSTEGSATGGRREGDATCATLASSTTACGDAPTAAGKEYNTARQPEGTVNNAEFEPLMDVTEAARLLRIHPKTLRVKAGQGIIPGLQIGRVWRFRASTLNRWLDGISERNQR